VLDVEMSRHRIVVSTSFPAWAGVTLALLLGAGGSCADGDGIDGPRACTEEARASVMVSIVDAGGAPFPGAAVTWRADGGVTHPAECVDFTQPPATCSHFVAGWEVPGTIEVRSEKTGFLTASAAVVVPMDEFGCHVITRQVTLVMLPARRDRR